MSTEVLIVGAGFAGASCALRLAEHGIKSTLIEARNRIGGRVETVKLAENVLIDFGASNVHGYGQPGNPAQRLAERLGIKLSVPKPATGMVFRGTDQIPQEEVDRLQKGIADIMAYREHTEDSDVSLGSRVLRQLRELSPDAEPLARTAELGAGIPLEKISAKYWKTEKGFAGADALPDQGYAAVIDAAIEQSGAKVILEKEVISIEEEDDGGVTVTDKDGASYSAPHAVITIPVAVLKTGRISFKPAIPQDRLSVLKRTSVGLLDKFSLLYQDVWWPKTAANFVFLPENTDKTVEAASSPLEVLEASTIMVANMHALSYASPPVLLVYIPPNSAKILEQYNDNDLSPTMHTFVEKRLARSSQSKQAPPQPTSGRMVRWGADPFALGATTSPMALGEDALPEDLDVLGQPLWNGKLGFAGEGTDRHLRGSVPGAVASGEREADRLIELLKQ